MKNPPQDKYNIDFNRLKQELHESDFDGHTAFHTLTFSQKLAWLSEAAVSAYLLAKGGRRPQPIKDGASESVKPSGLK